MVPMYLNIGFQGLALIEDQIYNPVFSQWLATLTKLLGWRIFSRKTHEIVGNGWVSRIGGMTNKVGPEPIVINGVIGPLKMAENTWLSLGLKKKRFQWSYIYIWALTYDWFSRAHQVVLRKWFHKQRCRILSNCLSRSTKNKVTHGVL